MPVVIGSIMAVLDVTIVNVDLHPLPTEFDAPLATVQWVATGYTLALCAVIPLAAWAMIRFGAKRAYLTALAHSPAAPPLATRAGARFKPSRHTPTTKGMIL